MYKYERGIGTNNIIGEEYHVYSGNPTTWPGNIALMYPSDYGYASDTKTCTDNLFSCEDLTANNWLCKGIDEWLLSLCSSSHAGVFIVNSSGGVATYRVNLSRAVRPVLFLSPAILKVSGDGTSEQPYTIE